MKSIYVAVIISLLTCESHAQMGNDPLSPVPRSASFRNRYTLKDGTLYLITNNVLTEANPDCTLTHPGLVMRGTSYHLNEGQSGHLLEGEAIDFNGRISSYADLMREVIDPRINPSQNMFSAVIKSHDSLAVPKSGIKQFPQIDYHMKPTPAAESQAPLEFPK